MAKDPISTIIKVDLKKPYHEQPGLHTRWHPEIPFYCKVKPGEVFKVECFDSSGGQVFNTDDADDIKNVNPMGIHCLSGPIEVEGAEPGDLLIVEIQDVQPFPDEPWGYTAIMDPAKSSAFLGDIYPNMQKAIWDFNGIFASSRHIPHVKFPGFIHPGIIGTLPSYEMMNIWKERESKLVDFHASINTPHTVAALPNPDGAYAGQDVSAELAKKIAEEGVRTVPPREHGGNIDIKNLSRGAKAYLPVYVKGAGFSVGDIHFSEGDGEISFCGAIEMHGIITLKLGLIKNGMKDLSIYNPVFLPGPVEAHYGPSRYLTFQGISVDESGKQHFLDAKVAFRQAVLNAIEYLKKFGYSGEQAYLLLSAAPVETHISSIVDIPNSCVSYSIPADIFDFDIMPKEGGPTPQGDMGSTVFPTSK
ncbi:Acetamidase/Formamidase [Lipomyces orientalis]|uniref:Acetamidase/Formamidase n=1 Tax=Lipomyces orientalis TaxID=1233043 RepID=A0ACC3TTE5_9ASCO